MPPAHDTCIRPPPPPLTQILPTPTRYRRTHHPSLPNRTTLLFPSPFPPPAIRPQLEMSGSAAAGGPNGGAPGAGALNAKAALDAPPPAAAAPSSPAAAPQAALAAVPSAGAGERAAGAGHGTAAGPGPGPAPQPSRIRSASPRPKKRQRSVAASPAATTPTAHHAGVGGEEAEDGGGGRRRAAIRATPSTSSTRTEPWRPSSGPTRGRSTGWWPSGTTAGRSATGPGWPWTAWLASGPR